MSFLSLTTGAFEGPTRHSLDVQRPFRLPSFAGASASPTRYSSKIEILGSPVTWAQSFITRATPSEDPCRGAPLPEGASLLEGEAVDTDLVEKAVQSWEDQDE